MLILTTVLVIGHEVSLAVFMNPSGQDNITQRYSKSKLALDIDDDSDLLTNLQLRNNM
jgi:hypothetical protein